MVLEDLGLIKNVKLVVRLRNGQTPSHLDWIFTNEEFMTDNLSILASPDINDYVVTAFNFVGKTKPTNPTEDWCWNLKRMDE